MQQQQKQECWNQTAHPPLQILANDATLHMDGQVLLVHPQDVVLHTTNSLSTCSRNRGKEEEEEEEEEEDKDEEKEEGGGGGGEEDDDGQERGGKRRDGEEERSNSLHNTSEH